MRFIKLFIIAPAIAIVFNACSGGNESSPVSLDV